MKKDSVWKERSGECIYFPVLDKSLETDVVIIGGGITGLTAAYFLSKAGKKSILLEALHIGDGTTGMSSCHLTTDIDDEYRNVFSDFGEDIMTLVADSRKEGINFIEQIIQENNIKCDFRRVPGYYYTDMPEDVGTIEQEYRYAGFAGLQVSIMNQAPLPFKTYKAVKFENQAQFNSQQYLNGLAKVLENSNCSIYENSRVVDFEEKDGYVIVKTERGEVRAKKVIMATHLPIFFDKLQTMAYPYMSYMITARLKDDNYPDALFWDSRDPYNYIRTYRDEHGPLLVVGGADHKAGHKHYTDEQFAALEKYVRSNFNVESIVHQWSAEYFEPADGLPYIGTSTLSKNVYVATGFSGDGLVYGPIAARIIVDSILGIKNKWAKTYDAQRFTPVASAFEFIKENASAAKDFIKDRLVTEGNSIDDIAPGDGKIIKVNGEKMAVARDENNEIHAVSPVCTHMKCYVHYNKSEQSWDCPCHGSRFSIDGKVMYGPAVTPLEKKDITEPISERKK